MTAIVIGDDAEADLLSAYSFYEERREGLGERFRTHVDFAMGRIQLAPGRYPLVHRDLRRRLVERFPYGIFYRVYPECVFVVAVMHAKQHPAEWQQRSTRSPRG